ncbi:MAG TPA: hypothetical protein VJ939_05970 [Bacteroidales bacterium]|nr:hypothetical protein [Bacteroidales bacterium]
MANKTTHLPMITQIVPTADTIPVNWWWFQILLIVTFLLHIILMNFILGGSLLSLWDSFRKKPAIEGKSIPTLIALTINLGVPPLLFVQVIFGNFFYTSSVLMAGPWILLIPILIIAYYGAYIYVFKKTSSPLFSKISLLISSIFLLFIGFMLVNNNTLMLTPERWSAYVDNKSGWMLNLGEPTLWPRYLHFIIGAIAIAGLGKTLFYHFKKDIDTETKQHEKSRGMKIFAFATMIQVVVGIWFWLSLPEPIWKFFMGGNIVATIWLMLGILLALVLIFTASRKLMTLTVSLAAFLLLNMIITREIVRHQYLKGIGEPSNLTTTGEIGSLILFLFTFLIGIALIYYMIKLIFKPKNTVI